jgi:hypothetical protein
MDEIDTSEVIKSYGYGVEAARGFIRTMQHGLSLKATIELLNKNKKGNYTGENGPFNLGWDDEIVYRIGFLKRTQYN